MRRLRVILHPLFLILGVVLMVMGSASTFFICTISAFLHELGHSVVAGRYGYKMEKIRLMPFGAELHGDTDSFDGLDEIYIALAGPLVNFFICLVILGVWWVNPGVYEFTHPIFENNLVMGIFNLMPLFPLDGGRILLSGLSRKMTRRESARVVKNITKVSAVVLFVCFVLTLFREVNLSLGVMAFLLFFTASSSAKDAVYQKVCLKKLVQSRSVQWVYLSIPESLKVFELRRLHMKNRVTVFMVLDKAGREVFRFSELELELLDSRLDQSLEVKEIKRVLSRNNLDKDKIL